MKPTSRLFSFHPLAYLTVGLGVGLIGGWSLGRGGNAVAQGDEKSGHGTARSASGSYGGAGAAEDGSAAAMGRDRGASGSAREAKDLGQAARAIFKENVKARRVALFEKLVERTSLDRFPDLVALIHENDLKGNDSGEEWTRVWRSWSERDPQGAMDFFMSYDWTGWNDMATGEARNRILANWASADPEKARAYVEANEDFINGDRKMIYGLIEGWANTDPEGAANWIFKNGLGMSAEYDMISSALRRKHGKEGFENWFYQLDPTSVQGKDLAGFSRHLPPEKTAAWLAEHSGESWANDGDLGRETAMAYAEKDPEAAAKWAMMSGIIGAQQVSVAVWCNKDLDAASTWVRENAGELSDPHVALMVMHYMKRKDSQAAQDWANGFSDENLRQRLLGN